MAGLATKFSFDGIVSRGRRDTGAFDLVIRRAGAAGVTRRRLVAGVVDEDEELSRRELSASGAAFFCPFVTAGLFLGGLPRGRFEGGRGGGFPALLAASTALS